MDVIGLICGVVVNITISTVDIDNGIYTYLLKTTRVPAKKCANSENIVEQQYNPLYIGYKAPELLGKEGDTLDIRLDAKCFQMHGVDEGASDKLNRWVPYKTWACDATKLEVIKNVKNNYEFD